MLNTEGQIIIVIDRFENFFVHENSKLSFGAKKFMTYDHDQVLLVDRFNQDLVKFVILLLIMYRYYY